jgi:hypothetical protein
MTQDGSFTAAYKAALLDSLNAPDADLAPEALAAIMRDCATAQTGWPGPKYHQNDGGFFWWQRQVGGYPRTNPPLTPYVGDDGKVRGCGE